MSCRARPGGCRAAWADRPEPLDDYLQNVREIEARIEKMERQASTSVAATPTALPNEFGELVDMMCDLMTVAFQADITRVSSFMMARELSNIVLPEIGINEPHHALSHHQNKPERSNLHAHQRVHGQLVAKFLAKLKATPDGDGSLLDHSLVMWGCGMSNPNIHTYDPLPFVLAGRRFRAPQGRPAHRASARHRGGKSSPDARAAPACRPKRLATARARFRSRRNRTSLDDADRRTAMKARMIGVGMALVLGCVAGLNAQQAAAPKKAPAATDVYCRLRT
jgi:hypothetical protein